jgi:signal transduction histidine kinase
MVIIVGLIVFVWRLRRDLRQSRTTEQTSAVFSRMTILAQENERARIAAELHDTVLQDLGRLMQITGPAQSTGGEPLRPLEESLMRNLRGVCTDIMPPDFSRLALTDSLIQLCMDFEKRTGVECRISIEEEADTGNRLPERQLQVYRIVQEALMNIEKHAAATEAVVTVRNFVPPRSKAQVPRKVKLSRKAGLFRKAGLSMLIYVSDDGRGFPGGLEPGSSPGLRNLGLGIRGMYERAAILEADLSFISGPEDGVTLRLEIPLPR